MKISSLLLITFFSLSIPTRTVSQKATDTLAAPKSFMAQVIDVYDGDTCTVEICIWGENKQALFIQEVIRLYGIDTPELRTKDADEKQRGYAAKQFLADRVLNKIIRLEMVAREKFGRYMANVFYTDANGQEQCVNKELIDAGHAVAYFGGHRSVDSFDPTQDSTDNAAYDRED